MLPGKLGQSPYVIYPLTTDLFPMANTSNHQLPRLSFLSLNSRRSILPGTPIVSAPSILIHSILITLDHSGSLLRWNIHRRL